MTKLKATKATPKAKLETFVLQSGSHSRVENGIRRKYEAGDTIELSASEVAKFPMKFLTLEEVENLFAEDERRKRADRMMANAMFPPRVKKVGERDAAALKRQRKFLKMRHRNSRVTYM